MTLLYQKKREKFLPSIMETPNNRQFDSIIEEDEGRTPLYQPAAHSMVATSLGSPFP